MSFRQRPNPDPVMPGQESVWNYPRPPRLEHSLRRVLVELAGTIVADTVRAWRVLETSHPPTYYVHPDDVSWDLVEPAGMRGSFCEWKGQATYWTVQVGDVRVEGGAWSYPAPTSTFSEIAGHLAFYPARFACFLDDEPVTPQPGGFYGGWVTKEIAGPFKGDVGTMGW